MADPRIINLPGNPSGPDSSGVGAMLFERMQGQYKDQEAAKQLDVTEGIRAKYKAQADAQANQYNQGMEQLRSSLMQGRTDQLWQQEQGLRQQEAQGLQKMVGQASQAGVNLPGLMGQPGETLGTQTIPGTPNEIPPNAIVEARKAFGEGMAAHFQKLEDKNKLSTEVERDQIRQTLDLTTDSDARQVEQMAGAFDAADNPTMGSLLRAQFGTAGQASRSVWQNFQKVGMEKLLTSQAAQQTKIQVTQEITQRDKELQQMKNKSRELMAGSKVDNTAYKNLDTLHKSMGAAVARREQLQKIMSDSLLVETPGSPAHRKLQFDMANNAAAINESFNNMSELRQKMSQFTDKSSTGEVPPTPKGRSLGDNPFAPKPIK